MSEQKTASEELRVAKPGPAFTRPIFWLTERVTALSSISLILLAGIVIADVIGRAFNTPLSSGSDIGAMLMVGLIFFAMAGTQVEYDHVSMDSLVAAFPPRLRRLTDKLSLLVCLAAGLFLTQGAVRAAIKSFNGGEMALGALALPLWPAKTVIAFGLALYSLVVFAQLLGVNPSGKQQDSIPPEGTE